MKKIFVLTCLLSGLFSLPAQAEAQKEEFVGLNTVRVQPCRFWNYSTEARGYVCSSYEFGVEIPDAFQLDTQLRRMEDRIKTLEEKIKGLEARQ